MDVGHVCQYCKYSLLHFFWQFCYFVLLRRAHLWCSALTLEFVLRDYPWLCLRKLDKHRTQVDHRQSKHLINGTISAAKLCYCELCSTVVFHFPGKNLPGPCLRTTALSIKSLSELSELMLFASRASAVYASSLPSPPSLSFPFSLLSSLLLLGSTLCPSASRPLVLIGN